MLRLQAVACWELLMCPCGHLAIPDAHELQTRSLVVAEAGSPSAVFTAEELNNC